MYVYYQGSITSPRPLRGDDDGRAEITIGAASQWLSQAFLHVDSVSASGNYVLIDLSDTANFPHTATANLFLKKLILDAEVIGDGEFKLYVGVVKENDSIDGSVDWLHIFHLTTPEDGADGVRRVADTVDFCPGGDPRGISLIVSGGALSSIVTNASQDDTLFWKDDQARTSPAGTSIPGVGDLVVFLEEVAGAGAIEFGLTALYSTET